MRAFLKLYASAIAMIFIDTNLLLRVTANLDSTTPPTTATESFAKSDSQTHVVNDDFNIDPLPANIFTAEISEFLSPDMFWQANPLVYFLKKSSKIPYETVRRISNNLSNIVNVKAERLPQCYVPYANFVSTLLSCANQLHDDIEESTKNIQSKYPHTLPDIFEQDPVLSPLLSSYVFSDKNPPNRLVLRLTEIPDDELDSVWTRLQNLLNHRYFPRRYSLFTKCLQLFFKATINLLRKLRNELVEIREITSAIPRDKLQIDNEIDLPAEDPDTSAQSTQPSEKKATAVVSKDELTWAFRKEVRDFLSPDMFSQADPFAYFLAKAAKLQKDILRQTNYHVTYSLDREEFPPRYIPYAELATSIFSCLEQLENTDRIIEDYTRSRSYNRSFSPTSYKLDPEILKFFSDDILARKKSRTRILTKVIEVPENVISNLANRLQNHLKDMRFPRGYRRYAHLLMEFFRHDYLILRLKDNIAEIQHTPDTNSRTPDQPNSTIG